MASRAELIEMCKELDIKCTDFSISEMAEEIKKVVDKTFRRGQIKKSADNLSLALKKFLTEEYDYVIKDKDGNIINYKGEKK